MQNTTTSAPMSDTEEENVMVGTIAIWDPVRKIVGDLVDIFSHKDVFIGRSKTCDLQVDGVHISNKHIRIFAILYGEDDMDFEVPPLVYAEDISSNGSLWNDHQMGPRQGGFLLSNGDILTLMPGVHLRFRSAGAQEDCQFTSIQRSEMRIFNDTFAVTPRVLGQGTFGRVHMALVQGTGRQLACKIIDLVALKASFLRDAGTDEQPQDAASKVEAKIKIFNREAHVLSTVSHPNIISIERAFRSNNTIYLLSELGTAGDLQSFIRYKNGKMEDKVAAFIVYQLLLALNHLHKQNIVHRDIKPENILITFRKDGGRVILTDFGCAKWVSPSTRRKELVVGTLGYCAPELRRGSRSVCLKAADMWSVGCVIAALLVGDSPFKDPLDDLAEEFALLEMDLEENQIGKQPTGFLLNLLSEERHDRMSAREALSHDWLKNPDIKGWISERYSEAIQYWRPRVHRGPTMIDLTCLMTPQARQNTATPISARRVEDIQGRPVDNVSGLSDNELSDRAGKPAASPAASTPSRPAQCLPQAIEFPMQSNRPAVSPSRHANQKRHSPPSPNESAPKSMEPLGRNRRSAFAPVSAAIPPENLHSQIVEPPDQPVFLSDIRREDRGRKRRRIYGQDVDASGEPF